MHLPSLRTLQLVVASGLPVWSWAVPRAAGAALSAAHQRKQMLHRSLGCAGQQQGLCTSHHAASKTLLRQLQRPPFSLPQRAGAHSPRSNSSSDRVRAAHTLTRAPAAHPSFLSNLSAEQLDAVVAQEQHLRVIAGPGSGKTRVVAARVGWLLQQGASARSILAITFTRKAAGELRARLSADTGRVPAGLTACTFHSLCTEILRLYAAEAGLEGWTVAAEDDCLDIIASILQPRQQEEENQEQQQAAEAQEQPVESSDEEQPVQSNHSSSSSKSTAAVSASTSESIKSSSKASKPKAPDKEVVKYFRKRISAMKSFVESSHSEGRLKSGAAIIAELVQSAAPDFVKLKEEEKLMHAAQLASVFDRYQAMLRWQRLLDFDDLLHHCLALLHSNEQVRSEIHRRWKHVHVDEGQDTNLCQFELVRQITGPDSTLYMVGDPDQAIYYFRGAQAIWLQEKFLKVYAGSAATYTLRDNYRSHQPIIAVADSIRKHLRPRSYQLAHGRSMRKAPDQHVQLVAAPTEVDEYDVIIKQLQEWHSQGYAWDDMAVLSRTKRPIKSVYLHAVRNAVPAHLQIGDFWDAPEVKASLALLRAVVHPVAASEGIKRRIVKSSSEVKVPITSGFGPKPLESVEAIVLAANLARERSSESSSSSSSPAATAAEHAADAIPTSLSGCLLAGCGLGSLTQQQAAAVWQQWQEAAASGDEDWMDILQHLAPQWQQPPGMKRPTKKQQAGLDRLRGLVQLATAAAVLGRPVQEVVQLLVTGSGMVQALREVASKATDRDKLRRAVNRERNLKVLVQLAGLPDFAAQAVPLLDSLEEDEDEEEEEEEELDWPVSPFGVTSMLHSAGCTAGSSLAVAGQDMLAGSSSDGSSKSSRNGGSDGSSSSTSLLLQEFVDFCGLQGDDDGEQAGQREPRVAFLTMHASKGKEFSCVAAMSLYEGSLPSVRASTPAELEQERNLAYVAVTRAKDQLLISWPQTMVTGQYRSTVYLQVSRFLKDVLHAARQGKLPGVQYEEAGGSTAGSPRPWPARR